MADLGEITREEVSIPVRERGHTSGILTLPKRDLKQAGVIVAHGAGNDMKTPLLVTSPKGSLQPAIRH